MTLAERLLARASGRRSVLPGEIVEADVDIAMAHEACAQVIEPFERMGARKVWDRTRIVIPIDHWVPASTEHSATLHRSIREFVRKYGIEHFYDVGRHGICHQVLVEERFVLPGDLVVGTDSHTNMAGALGAFASGIGPTEMAAVFATGRIWLRVPRTVLAHISGRLGPPAASKDLALKIIGSLGDDGARYMAVEFAGPAIASMELWERLTLTNMTTEMGAKAGLIPPDARVREHLEAGDIKNGRGADLEERLSLAPDSDAGYARKLEVDASEVEPMVACPSSPTNVRPITEVEGTPVDQVFIGSCTNARIQDLRVAARVLKGRHIADNVRLLVFPATTRVYRQAVREGLMDIFMDAGGVFNPASCGACFGGMGGVLGKDEVCASTSNRNYVGRMGHPTAKVYLMSPASAAATAIEGRITRPGRTDA